MSNDWPGKWKSGEEKRENTRMTNDHGTLYLVEDPTKGEWMRAYDIPAELQTRC